MRTTLYLLVLFLGFGLGAVRAADSSAAGIIILQAGPGSSGGAVEFASIQWTGNAGGYVVDAAGKQTNFINDAVGRIFYYDQGYYEEINHNQYWIDWRAGLQGREFVIAPLDTISLRSDDATRLQSEQKVLEDSLQRYPTGQPVLGPMITTIKDDIAKLSSGLVLQNGKWIAAKDAAAETVEAVPVVGDSSSLATFSTKDGKTYSHAKVIVTNTGVNLLTSDGGGTVTFENLPDDLSPFPASIRAKIQAAEAKHKADLAAAAEANKPPPTIWDTVQAYFWSFVNQVRAYFSKASTAESSNSATNAPSDSTNSATSLFSPRTIVAPAPDISLSIIQVKGDNAQGTGFLTKVGGQPVIITNLQLIAANPNVKFLTAKGEKIPTTEFKGAADRDLAMFTIQDNGYAYLNLPSNFSGISVDDPTIIPSDSDRGPTVPKGSILAIASQRVEVTNVVRHMTSAGSPIIDAKNGEVIAVVGSPIIGSSVRQPSSFVGLRIDTVSDWRPYNQFQFLTETLFLRDFHELNRALDSFINGNGYGHATITSDDGPPDAKFYLGDDKVKALADKFPNLAGPNTSPTASPELIAGLQDLAGDGVGELQSIQSFYDYDQPRAKSELDYRSALKAELDEMQGKNGSSSPPAQPAPSAPATPSAEPAPPAVPAPAPIQTNAAPTSMPPAQPDTNSATSPEAPPNSVTPPTPPATSGSTAPTDAKP